MFLIQHTVSQTAPAAYIVHFKHRLFGFPAMCAELSLCVETNFITSIAPTGSVHPYRCIINSFAAEEGKRQYWYLKTLEAAVPVLFYHIVPQVVLPLLLLLHECERT